MNVRILSLVLLLALASPLALVTGAQMIETGSYRKVLVIGLGEVGRALFELLKEKGFAVYGLDVDRAKMLEIGQMFSKIMMIGADCTRTLGRGMIIKDTGLTFDMKRIEANIDEEINNDQSICEKCYKRICEHIKKTKASLRNAKKTRASVKTVKKTIKKGYIWLIAAAVVFSPLTVLSQDVSTGQATANVLAVLVVTATHDLAFGDVLQGVPHVASKTVIADAGVFFR
jgi:hypothetical protein